MSDQRTPATPPAAALDARVDAVLALAPHLDPEQTAQLREATRRLLDLTEALGRHPLNNGDEPVGAFSAYRADR